MTEQKPMTDLRLPSPEAWRKWLAGHHGTERGVWLVFRKKGSGPVPFTYEQALDEALCYGWVDSLVRTIDAAEYKRKFTPRKPSSTWSDSNKKRVERLIAEGRMEPAGRKTVEVARENGMWNRGSSPPEVDERLPGALLQALQDNAEARRSYFAMPASQQRPFNIWINMARRPETVRRRVEEAVRKLEKGEELGLK